MPDQSNGFAIPFGLDLTSFIEQIKEGKIGITDIADAAKKGQASVQGMFTAADESAKKFNETIGSGDKLKSVAAPIKNLTDAYQKLKTISGGSFDGAKLAKYSAELKNVGVAVTGLATNYSKAFDPKKLAALDKQLKTTTSDFQELKVVLSFIKDNAADLKLNPEETDQLTESINGLVDAFDKAEKGTGKFNDKQDSAKSKLKALKAELANLDETDPQFIKLATEAAKLEDKIGDVSNTVKLLASDTSKLDAGIQVVQGLAAGYSILQSSQALLGSDNEELQKSLLKVNAAMSLLQGLQQIGALLDKNSALNIFLLKTLRTQDAVATTAEAVATEGLAVAEGEAAVATEGAIVATEGLTVAMLANPAAILLVAIAALAAGIIYLTSQTDRAIKKQIGFNDVQNKFLNIQQTIADRVAKKQDDEIQKAKDQLSLAEAQGKSEAETAILKLKVLDAEQKKQTALKPFVKDAIADGKTESELLFEQLRAIQKLDEATNKARLHDTDTNKDRVKAAEGALDNINAQLKAVQDFNKQSIEVTANTANLLAEIERKNFLNGLKSATALAEARVLVARKGSEQELNARLSFIKTEMEETLADVNLTEGERVKIKAQARKDEKDATREFEIAQIENQKAVQEKIIAENIEGSKEEFDAKISLIQLTANAELKAEGLSKQKIAAIQAKADRDRKDAIKAFVAASNTSLVEAQVSATNIQLSLVREGTEQELVLKKQGIEEQAQLQIINATATIKNEAEKQAKIKEIIAKSNREQLDLDRAFLQSKSDQRVALALSESSVINAALQGAAGNLQNNPEQRFQLQQQVRKNELADIDLQINEIEKLYVKGVISEADYQTKRNNLKAAGVAKRAEIDNEEIAHFKKFSLENKLLEGLGLSPDDPAVQEFVGNFSTAIKTAYQGITSALESEAQNQINAIQSVIDAIDQEIEAQQNKVDKEKSLADKGLANDLGNQEKLLADLKDKKAAEIQEQEKARDKLARIKRDELKIQAVSTAATNIETGVNMLNAASGIFKAHAGIPFVGVALAAGFAALLVATFLSLKNAFKAPEANIPTFKKGGSYDLYDALNGAPSHERGGADLYNSQTGERLAQFEGDEKLFVINKGAANKWAGLLEAINLDKSPAELIEAITGSEAVRMPETRNLIILQRKVQDHSFNHTGTDLSKEVKRIAEDVSELKELKKNEIQSWEDNNWFYTKVGNHITKMAKNKAPL